MGMTPNGTFKGILLGDFCWITPSFSNDKQVVHIPRADGVRIRNMGGGQKVYTVTAYVIKPLRTTLEQYFDALINSFGNPKGELIIDSHSYGDCFFTDISPETSYPNYNTFTLTFIKSL